MWTRKAISIRAEQSSAQTKKVVTPMTHLRNKVEKQRLATLRENMNKLSIVAGADVKFLYETFVELDLIHKKLFDYKEVSSKENEEEEGNIFLKKEDVEQEN